MPPEPPQIIKDEFRGGWLGMPKPFEVIDLLGFALGAYFTWNAVTKKGPDWFTITLGGIMMYIHSRRFFYAPQSRAGLINILNQLDLTPADITGALTTRK